MSSAQRRARRNLYVDMGANWANTLHLGAELFPHRGPWLTVAFEASPLIQPFLEAYAQFLNGNRSAAPVACLPRSGSTIHLRRYAGALGCAVEDNDAMRQCAWAKLAVHLARLRADPALNSTALVAHRLEAAARVSGVACAPACRSRVIAVPAAVGASEGWMRLWGAPSQLIRGGAKPVAPAGASSADFHIVRQVDVVAWLAVAARRVRQHHGVVFVKMDVEGAEHAILRRMEAAGVHRLLSALAVECHDPGCPATMRRIRGWGVRIWTEADYGGMDRASAAETTLPEKCLNASASAVFRTPASPAKPSAPCTPASLPPKVYTTCAVVGSAPSMAHLYQGGEIDSHDAVFRTNAHALVATTGTKTTVRVAANAKQLGAARRRDDGAQNLVPAASRCVPPGNLVRQRDRVACVPAQLLDAIYADSGVRFGAHILSTGGLAIGLALHSCASVALYGFGGLQSYDHVLRDRHHDWRAEAAWIRRLVAEHRVADRTDRGVHLRRCESVALLDHVEAQYRGKPGAVQALRAARARLSEGCPPKRGALARLLGRASSDTADVDKELVKRQNQQA